MNVNISILIAAAGFLLSVLTVTLNYFGVLIKVKEDIASIRTTIEDNDVPKIGDRLTALETLVVSHGDVAGRLAKLETEMKIFWDRMDDVIKAIIHHPNTPRKDELVEKFPNLTIAELCELRKYIEEEKDELLITKDVKAAIYALMEARIDGILAQLEKKC